MSLFPQRHFFYAHFLHNLQTSCHFVSIIPIGTKNAIQAIVLIKIY